MGSPFGQHAACRAATGEAGKAAAAIDEDVIESVGNELLGGANEPEHGTRRRGECFVSSKQRCNGLGSFRMMLAPCLNQGTRIDCKQQILSRRWPIAP